jgi:putative membrane-bound dehydrogenase-like protein
MKCLFFLTSAVLVATVSAKPPEILDASYELSVFAESPDIVTPIGATFDADGRLLVIESHTHFRPNDYDGPPADRIRMLEDTDGDGRADRFTTFYEGLTHAMSLALAPDGSVYVATRSEILQLLDLDRDGAAEKVVEIAKLETKGNYPHNGLSGLTFDKMGALWFGLGENLGEPYRLVAADGTAINGGGEGGNIYTCNSDGSKLTRIATGMWNPFALCFDPAGRLFCLDNDPDQTPYCRLLHIVPSGDYGYAFRYGRSGKHPLQAWEGELPGTLPIVAPSGEAPCALLAFDGNLWGTSWGNNRVERFALKENGASWKGEHEIVIQGDHEFRPVDFAQAPDGSLYFTDWVSSSYQLHKQGRVWRLARKEGKPSNDSWPPLTVSEKTAELATDDRFEWQAAVWGMVQNGVPSADAFAKLNDVRARLGVLAAAKWLGKTDGLMKAGLEDANEDVRLFAVRWVADERLTEFKGKVKEIAARATEESALGKAARTALEYLSTKE